MQEHEVGDSRFFQTESTLFQMLRLNIRKPKSIFFAVRTSKHII